MHHDKKVDHRQTSDFPLFSIVDCEQVSYLGMGQQYQSPKMNAKASTNSQSVLEIRGRSKSHSSETENWVCLNFLEDSLEDIPFLFFRPWSLKRPWAGTATA